MALPAWWEIATPHKDIREGFLDEKVFAADLGYVLAKRAPVEYQDAMLFFRRTYPTRGLKQLLENVFSRLGGGPGDTVIQLQTPFGGGKTHALLALYHSVKNPELATETWNLNKLNIAAKVAVFVGTRADVLYGRTPWGEIAEQFGFYEIVAQHDKKRISPGKDRLNTLLDKTGPCLILIDELLEYVVKAGRAEQTLNTARGQVLAFLQELSEVIGSRDNAVLVVTLPSSALEQYDEEAERTLAQLQHVLGRLETIYTPVEGVEIYEIIRKRLFEDLGDSHKHQEIAQEFYELYERLGADVPTEVRELSYRDKIARAYPFHPELIDVLYERWGSFPRFQRTRGVLRLLAEVIKELYEKRSPIPLIQSAQSNLERQRIKQELLKHLGSDYESIITYDIIERSSRIDRTMGSEHSRFNMARGLAQAIFLYSFSATSRNGINLPKLRVASLYPGLPSAMIADTLSKLEDDLWFLHSEAGLYLFKKEPNLNRIIVEREEAISEEEILERLKIMLQKILAGEFKVILWPERTGNVPDLKELQLVILSPEYAFGDGIDEKIISFVKEIFFQAGQGFRTYRNALFVLMPDARQINKLLARVKRLLTLEHLVQDKSFSTLLRKEDISELKTRLSEVKKNIQDEIINTYTRLALMKTGGGILTLTLPMHLSGQTTSLTGRIKEFLIENEKILQEISPKYLLDKAFAPDENEKTLNDIYEVFLKTPGLALPVSMDVVRNTVKNGVKIGSLGIKSDDQVIIDQPLDEINIFSDTLILKPEVARLLSSDSDNTESPPQQKPLKVKETPKPMVSQAQLSPTIKSSSLDTNQRQKVYIRANVPWDKMAHIISGVIGPLKSEAEIQVTLEITALSSDGINTTTLETKVKETLQQIGADIEKWEDE